MSAAAIAARMTSADLLKLRKKRGTLIWALVLTLAPIVIYFVIRAAQHSSNPAQYEPAGGVHGYSDALRILALFGGPLAAILIGVDAGAGDAASGVFRDLVVTGRDRLALFVTRVPAAILLAWAVVCAGYALVAIGTLSFASGTPTPRGTLFLNGLGFSLLSTGVICAVAVGFSSLTASRPAALTVLIGWHLVASPVLAHIESLGSVRKLILDQAIEHFSPVHLDGGMHSVAVTMAQATALIVLVVWVLLFVALGAWRTRTMDA
jgi:ABC-type transport system involved in multi-copper enzyme maturation permease subunit